MARLVLDSNILIYVSQGKYDLADLPEKYSDLYISSISYMEVMGYAFSDGNEELEMDALLKSFEIVETNREINKKVIEYRKRKKIKIPDAIIMATANYLEADLLTNNVKDFTGIDESVQIISFEN